MADGTIVGGSLAEAVTMKGLILHKVGLPHARTLNSLFPVHSEQVRLRNGALLTTDTGHLLDIKSVKVHVVTRQDAAAIGTFSLDIIFALTIEDMGLFSTSFVYFMHSYEFQLPKEVMSKLRYILHSKHTKTF